MKKDKSLKIGKLVIIFAFFIILQNQSTGFAATTSRELISEEGGFSVWMPGEPKFEETIHKSAVGDVIEKTYNFRRKTEDFSASFTKLPGIATFFVGNKSLIKKARKGYIEDSGAVETGSEFTTFMGKPALNMEFTLPDSKIGPAKGKAFFFVLKKKLYVLVTTTNRGSAGMVHLDHFLKSFKILPRQSSIPLHSNFQGESEFEGF